MPKRKPDLLPPIPKHIPTRDELLLAAAEAEAGPKDRPLPKEGPQQ